MKILVTGSHGLVGTELISYLEGHGHEIVAIVRGQPASNQIKWDPETGQIDKTKLEGFDGVVHLAGDSIASGRWTADKKARIRDSRIKGTKLLCETLAALGKPPKVLISASAIGFYGDRGDELLTEESPRGAGFLADVCSEWENSTAAAHKKGISTVLMRFGVILSTKSGALAKMLPPFQLGAGGPLGSGKQYMSWIALDDAIGAIEYSLTNESLSGPVNAVAPDAVTNLEFTKSLGAALSRPTILPVPAFGLHLLLGEMADELLLSSQRVEPKKLSTSGYKFRQPALASALRTLV